MNVGWNKALDRAQAEKHRQLTNSKLATEFSETEWIRGWPMMPLGELDADREERFRGLMNQIKGEVT